MAGWTRGGIDLPCAGFDVSAVNFAFGGTPERSIAASQDSWARIVPFLQSALP